MRLTGRQPRVHKELAIQVLTSAGFSAPEADTVHRSLAKLPVDDRIELVHKVAKSVSGPKGRHVRVSSIQGCPPFTLGKKRGAALCLELMLDRSPKVRLELAQTLGVVDWSGREPLLRWLAQDSDRKVRKAAAAHLQTLRPDAKALGKRRRVFRLDIETLDLSGGFETGMPIVYGSPRLPSPTMMACPVPVGYGVPHDESPPPPPGAATEETVAESLPAATVTRHTDVTFEPSADDPAAGDLSFALLVQAASAEAHRVDLQVAAGKTHALVLVQAHSTAFEVTPGTRTIRVPRNGDSQAAVFGVRAHAVRTGVVSLLVYDELRLTGSIEVRLRAAETERGLALEREGTAVWRDPAASVPLASPGLTVQASLAEQGTSRVEYRVLVRGEKKGIGVPRLVPLGRSPQRFNADHVRAALASLRAEVDEIEKGIDAPATLGVVSAEEAMEGLRINFEGVGRQLGTDILSPEVWGLIKSRPTGSVVNWVIPDHELDDLPWELAYDPETRRALSEEFVLVRVPVHGEWDPGAGPASPMPVTAAAEADPARLLYVLGDLGAGGPRLFERFRKVVKSAKGKGYEVETNFDGPERQAMNLMMLKEKVRGARVVHLLCHGFVNEGEGLYLALEKKEFGIYGRVNPGQVVTFQPAPGALVFVNACSSAAATFSATGLSTFGWNFLQAGAGAYVGTLAPVTTELALRFAEAFFDAHLGEGVPVAEAVFRARQALKGGNDPTWMLYVVYIYTALHTPPPPPSLS